MKTDSVEQGREKSALQRAASAITRLDIFCASRCGASGTDMHYLITQYIYIYIYICVCVYVYISRFYLCTYLYAVKTHTHRFAVDCWRQYHSPNLPPSLAALLQNTHIVAPCDIVTRVVTCDFNETLFRSLFSRSFIRDSVKTTSLIGDWQYRIVSIGIEIISIFSMSQMISLDDAHPAWKMSRLRVLSRYHRKAIRNLTKLTPTRQLRECAA